MMSYARPALAKVSSTCAFALLFASLTLTGCADLSQSHETRSVAPQAQLQFVDLQGFDRDLAASLGAPLPLVNVAFYDRVVPSALPDRLQKWMASVEAGGGSVKIVAPATTVSSRSPLMLISAASALWTANKMVKEAAAAAHLRSAHAYDAQVQLKIDDKGDTVVDKVVFTQRAK